MYSKPQIISYMKKLMLSLAMTILVISGAMCQSNLKLISYNIWNGYDWGKDTIRKENQIAWIKGQQPDIMAMQEVCGYTDEKLKEDCAKWGHEYSVLLKTSGYSVGLTSKYPITLKEKIMEGMHHGALHCEVEGITIFVVHLSPFQWEKRNAEADILLPKIKKAIADNGKVIVCGDFNAKSPIDADWYNSNDVLLKKMAESDEKHGHVHNLKDGQFCYTAISKFLGEGLTDVCAKYVSSGNARISCPTLVFAKNKKEEKDLIEGGNRIDFILTSYELAKNCTNAFVYNGRETANLSDHYPVGAEFRKVER
ncbi:hypothetical protein EYV94_03040 [Puteibacter caeruleilacunae]|nr:hypothetical protein EYV94_03040 [Puteibacter caeruleilacunae]